MIVTINDKKFYIEPYLKENLDRAKKIITKDWDMIFLYDGYEGSGKSVKCMQDAFYFDPTLTLDRICFTPFEFTKAIKNANKYQAVIYDEAYTGLSSRAAMSLINRTLIKMLAEIRQKNLFVSIVMPTFFDLDRYAAIWRSRALIHVYTTDNYDRGYFVFYNRTRKKQLYLLGKKFYSYSKPAYNFRGTFSNFYPVDETEYRAKKAASLIKQQGNEEQAMIQSAAQKMMFEKFMEAEDLTHKRKIEILDMPESTYWLWVKKYNDTGGLE